MQSFDSSGVRIAYCEEGEGEPILLIHGFASNVAANW
ncbi:MAG TPA: alpha/beta hydrolase, partial [Methylomirabilota bacterium]